MDTVPLRHTQAASQTPSALLGLQPGLRHLTTQGTRQMSINVGPHPGFMGPARGPGGVCTQAARHRTVGPEETVPDSVERLACANRKVPGGRLHQCGSHDKASPATDTGEDEGAGSFCAT